MDWLTCNAVAAAKQTTVTRLPMGMASTLGVAVVEQGMFVAVGNGAASNDGVSARMHRIPK